MRLGEKLRYLREIEGALRGRQGALTQAEVVRLLKKELRETISQAYLSQIESGARPHLTNSSRMLLAKFYKVHPGYLVDDPEGYQEELMSDLGALEDKLDLWLINGAERFRSDQEMSQALLRVARHGDSRMCVVLLGAILDNPGLAERLLQVLKPQVLKPAPAAAEAPPKALPKVRRRSQ
jgi:transcriptional regulator with XRE-family HTH domain